MKSTFKTIITAAALAGIVSVVINSVLYFIFHAAGVITDNVYVQENQPLTLLPVIFSSIVPSLLAGVVFFYFTCKFIYLFLSLFKISSSFFIRRVVNKSLQSCRVHRCRQTNYYFYGCSRNQHNLFALSI